jgi:hypothetical protein
MFLDRTQLRHTHLVGLPWMSDQLVVEIATYTKKKHTHNGRTSIFWAEFESAIAATKRPHERSGHCNMIPHTWRKTFKTMCRGLYTTMQCMTQYNMIALNIVHNNGLNSTTNSNIRFMCGSVSRDSSVNIGLLLARRSGDWISVGTRISAHVQSGPI